MAALGLVRCDGGGGGGLLGEAGRLTTARRPCGPASTCGRQGDNGGMAGGGYLALSCTIVKGSSMGKHQCDFDEYPPFCSVSGASIGYFMSSSWLL